MVRLATFARVRFGRRDQAPEGRFEPVLRTQIETSLFHPLLKSLQLFDTSKIKLRISVEQLLGLSLVHRLELTRVNKERDLVDADVVDQQLEVTSYS